MVLLIDKDIHKDKMLFQRNAMNYESNRYNGENIQARKEPDHKELASNLTER